MGCGWGIGIDNTVVDGARGIANDVRSAPERARAAKERYIYALISDAGDKIIEITSQEIKKAMDELARKFTSPLRL